MAKILRTSGAAKQAGVHPDTIRRWAEKGLIRASKTPTGQLRIDAASVPDPKSGAK